MTTVIGGGLPLVLPLDVDRNLLDPRDGEDSNLPQAPHQDLQQQWDHFNPSPLPPMLDHNAPHYSKGAAAGLRYTVILAASHTHPAHSVIHEAVGSGPQFQTLTPFFLTHHLLSYPLPPFSAISLA